jgi:adenosine/AMP kinase
MGSKIQRLFDDQGELPLTRAPSPAPVEHGVILSQPSMSAAVKLAANVSGLEEKEIYLALKIDAGHWTRILNGQAHFPLDKLDEFMTLVGNEVPLIWLAYRRGKGLHMLQTEAERQLAIEQAARIEAEKKVEMLKDILKSK